MYCKNCGKEIAGGSKFCNHCGSPVEELPQPQQPQPEAIEPSIHTKPESDSNDDAPEMRKPIFEEFQWNVSEYPDRNVIEKTEEIDFNWNANPDDIPETPRRVVKSVPQEQAQVKAAEQKTASDVSDDPAHPGAKEETLNGGDLEKEVFGQPQPPQNREEMSAMEKVNSFYTLNQKNEEFQKLIDAEYQRVKSGNAIEHELSEADKIAEQKMESRPLSTSMDDFFEREGVVQPYQPKAFESDVLQKIEAQEAEREAKRREEEARLAAIEEARREAEAKKKADEEAARQQELAKKKAEEEAARLQELAKKKAEEEAREAEEAKRRAEEEARKAAEEAKRRAEEEAKRRAEEEARFRAEAEARVKAAEEARLKAEADLKAAQEAAKIRAQQEARLAAEEEARFKAEQERKRLEAEEAERQLEAKRKRLAEEANQAVAQEEVKKVLEQTARMRKEEEAKIKAAVAGLRGVGAGTPEKPEVSKEVEEAHQATRNQINEMAKARDAYFAEIEEEPKAAPAKKARAVTGRETMLSSDDPARTRVIKKADIEAGLNEATRVASAKPAPAPADDDEFFNSLEAAGAVAGVVTEEPQPIDFKPAEEAEPVDELDDLLSQFETVNSMDGEHASQPEQFAEEELAPLPDQYAAEDKPGLNDTVLMPQNEAIDNSPANDFDNYGNEEAINYANQQGIQEQAQAGGGFESNAADEFYGDDFYDDEEEPLSKKEMKQREKEQKRIEKEQAKENKARKKKEKRDYIEADDDEYEETGGKGRIALKIILVVLIVILVAEVVGMGIRFLAPQSKAAELIDNQLNKIIQLITGDDTEYSVVAMQARTEPMDDKTDLINAQKGKNKDGNIEAITYSPGLGYDQQTDGQISDLVLSQPMTVVEWGKDEENYPVYYDEQVIGRIIAFESNKVNLMNKGNKKVLDMIDPNTTLYAETAALEGQQMDGRFTKLEIGEIRQAGTNYYVWVRETIGNNTVEKVYSMYPEKEFVMKMANCYEI